MAERLSMWVARVLAGWMVLASCSCARGTERGGDWAKPLQLLKRSAPEPSSGDRLTYQASLGEFEDWPVSLEVTELPWGVAVRLLVEQTDLSVMLPALDEEPTVTMDLTGMALGPALRELGGLVEMDPHVEAGIVRFVRESSSAVSFVQAGYLSPEQAKEVLLSVMPDSDIEIAGESIAVVGGMEDLGTAEAISELLRRVRSEVWLFTLHLVEVSRGALADM